MYIIEQIFPMDRKLHWEEGGIGFIALEAAKAVSLRNLCHTTSPFPGPW